MLKEKIKNLENIIKKLESNDTDLDQSFDLYESGNKILKELKLELKKYLKKQDND